MPTHYRGSQEVVRALDSYIKLERAADSVSARVERSFAEAGLTHSQFGALEALFHLGPLCQRDLSRKVLRSSGNMTMVIDNLEKRGLARRQRGERDRRFITVHLTPKGRGLIREIFPRHAARIREQMSALSGSQQEQLGRLCRRLGLGKKGR